MSLSLFLLSTSFLYKGMLTYSVSNIIKPIKVSLVVNAIKHA